MKCNICGQETGSGKKFCPHCGAPLPKQRFCSKCGSPIENNAKFCKSCGTPVPPLPANEAASHPKVHENVTQRAATSVTSAAPEPSVKSATIVNRTSSPVPDPGSQSFSTSIPSGQDGDGSMPDAPQAQQEEYPDVEEAASEPIFIYEEPKKGKGAVWLVIGLLVVAIVGGLVWWKFMDSESQAPKMVGSDSSSKPDSTEMTYDNVAEAIKNTESQESESDVQNEYSAASRISVPSAAGMSSSGAYEVYPSYITDASMGDNWRSTSTVTEARANGSVKSDMSVTGHIKGNDVGFEAVLLKNGRIYGRYKHSNGTKLDVNGVVDEDGNLIIKLGHGSETSYWVLHKDGSPEGGNTIRYSGTWGKGNVNTAIRCVYTSASSMSQSSGGKHSIKGAVEMSGKSYPFEITYEGAEDNMRNAKYINSNYNATANLTSAKKENGMYYFAGKLGKDNLIIRFSASSPYRGTMTAGNTTADITMKM